LKIAAGPQSRARDVGGDIFRSMLGSVETDDPNRVLILPFKHVHDDRFEVGSLDVSFAVGPAVTAEIIDDKVDILIVAARHDRRGPMVQLDLRMMHRVVDGPSNDARVAPLGIADRAGFVNFLAGIGRRRRTWQHCSALKLC